MTELLYYSYLRPCVGGPGSRPLPIDQNLGLVVTAPNSLPADTGQVFIYILNFLPLFTAARPAYAGTEGCFGLLVFFFLFLFNA